MWKKKSTIKHAISFLLIYIASFLAKFFQYLITVYAVPFFDCKTFLRLWYIQLIRSIDSIFLTCYFCQCRSGNHHERLLFCFFCWLHSILSMCGFLTAVSWLVQVFISAFALLSWIWICIIYLSLLLCMFWQFVCILTL